MLKDSLPKLSIIGGIALIFLTFTCNQHIKWWFNTTSVAQVVEEFNSTKQVKASIWDAPIQTIPEISAEEVLASLSRRYEASDATSSQRQAIETVLRTQRIPEYSVIRVSEIDALDPASEVQLEILIVQSELDGQNSCDKNWSVPLEL